MKVLKSWLKDYISNEISDERLVEILSLAGLEVDEVTFGIDENVIVGKIVEIAKHPNADKLQIAIVDSGQDKIQIVCGAPNIKVGQLVPLALPGSKLPAGEISVSKIRGVESFGMLCAKDELGLGDDHKGIFILSKGYEVGKSLAEYINSDTVIDLDITANRGDCLSHIGVAREIAAFENISVRKEPVTLSKTVSNHSSTMISVEIDAPDLCPTYMTRVIGGVKIGPSPKWLQDRLLACGAKPINNVVDVTNYIMLDLGQPMHAFDLNKIAESKIIVRVAKNKESILTLDGVERKLSAETLVIADKKNPIAVAGIMGGKNSEVDDDTETIVLEAAEFDSKSIRKSAKSLNLSTEASYRFERGIDSGAIEYAINKAANLIVETAGGKIFQGIVQAGEKVKRVEIPFDYKKITQLLGYEISETEIDHILRHLGFTITGKVATAPSWRHDISIWQDLAEEVGRVIGYDKISAVTLPKVASAPKTDYYFTESIKDKLINFGFTEVINYPFLSEADVAVAQLKIVNLLEVANPMQAENKYLRPSLVTGLLKNVAHNPSFDSIQIFEVGHVYDKKEETVNLAIASAGKSTEAHKENIDKILLLIGDQKIVKTFEFTRDDLQKYKIKKPTVLISEINLSKILAGKKIDQNINLSVEKNNIIYRGVSKFPALTRDLAFIVDKKLEAKKISDEIYSISELINRVELFDEFLSDKFGAGKKNLAYHIYLQSPERTLNDQGVENIIKEIILSIEKKFNAKLRKV